MQTGFEKTPEERAKSLHLSVLTDAWNERENWVPTWTELAENFYPIKLRSLQSGTHTERQALTRNTKMLDGHPARSLYTLAAGFMNGVTSPARKWLKVKAPTEAPYDMGDESESEELNNIQTKILEVLAGSNYYDSRAAQVYDGCGLGTSVILCYEDFNTVCKFIMLSPGSFALVTDNYNKVVKIVRKMRMRTTDLAAEFGEANLTRAMREKLKTVSQGRKDYYNVVHIIEENVRKDKLLSSPAEFREVYFLEGAQAGDPPYLAVRPLWEWPAGILRWDCPDNSTYGVPPTMSAVGKAIQLQNLEYKEDQGLDKVISPPVLADYSLKQKGNAFGSGQVTYTNNLSPNSGARALLQIQVPFQELAMKRQRIGEAINDFLFNPLFNMISELDTVRTATEIDARREEKLVQLGPVLHRGYNEDLGPIVLRVYGICLRKEIIQAPSEDSSISFNNILSDVQKASDVSVIERFFGFSGQIISAFPEVQPTINADTLLRQYAEGLGIRPNGLNSKEQAVEGQEAMGAMNSLQQVSEVAKNFGGATGGLGGLAEGGVGGGLEAVMQGL